MEASEAIAAAHADSRIKMQTALAVLRMAFIDPNRMSYQEACQRALAELEDVPQVAIILREVPVAIEMQPNHKLRRTTDIYLTPRQEQMVILMADGHTTDQIGNILMISPNTVKSHIREVFRILGVGTRAGAVTKAISLGILDVQKLGKT